jgi:hypothetical protein
MEYTKGPWILEENHGKHESAFTIVCNSQQMWLAKVGHPHDDPEITINNAQLMVAAPDMYEALKEAQEYLRITEAFESNSFGELTRMVEQALSKAEGRNDQ